MGKGSRESRYRRLRRFSNGPHPALTIRYGRRYLADYPEDGYAWLLVGVALVELARYEEAEHAYAKAIELCPPDRMHVCWDQLGHMFRASGDFEQAASWYQKAVESDPDDAGHRIFLGAVLARQGRLNDAEEVHRAAVACAEGCIDEAYLNLDFILRARERYAEAADCFREAIRLDPEYRAAKRALRDVELCLDLK